MNHHVAKLCDPKVHLKICGIKTKLLLHYQKQLVNVFEGNNICVLSGFRLGVRELFVLLGCYTA
jgi:hypothetical protein